MNITIKLHEIHRQIGGDLVGNGEKEISGVNSLDYANTDQISYIANKKHLSALEKTQAGACVIDKSLESIASFSNVIYVENAEKVFHLIVDMLIPIEQEPPGFIHPQANVDESARIGANVRVHAFASISEKAMIGDNSTIMPGVYIGKNVSIGRKTKIYPNSVIYDDVVIGDSVIINSCSVIGKRGFGNYEDKSEKIVALRHVGKVIIEDNVEIGGGCVIDRATYAQTVIKSGSKLDNLIHIAHNVQIGENNMIGGQVGFSGSVKTGNNCIFLGQAGIEQGVSVNERTILLGKGAMRHSNLEGGIWGGDYALPYNQLMKKEVNLMKVGEYRKAMKELSKEVNELKDEIKKLKKS